MEKIIIYGSRYGTTQRYAGEWSKRTSVRSVGYKEINDLSRYGTILYLGALLPVVF